MTALSSLPATTERRDGSERRRRSSPLVWLTAGAAVVAIVATAVGLVLASGGGGTSALTASSGSSCQPVGSADGLPGTSGAVSCAPAPGISAAFAHLGSPADALPYLQRLQRDHPGSQLSGWVHRGAAGDALYFRVDGTSTVVWTENGHADVGWAQSDSTSRLDAWWTGHGLTTVAG